MKTKPQILVVDDNEVMLRLLTGLLSRNYEVISKKSAIEAFRWLEEGNHPALIISDLMTSSMDNTAFIRNLKVSGFYKDTPIIMLSAVVNSSTEIENVLSKVNAFFPKPFNPIQLTDTISQLLTPHLHAAA
jgi:CheY-like chemotaxis protein